MVKVAEDSQKIGNFLDWLLQEQDIHLCSPHIHNDNCYEHGTVEPPADGKRSWDSGINYRQKYTDEKWLVCGYKENENVLVRESFEKLLARYFDIDLDKVEKEKRAMLEELRKR
jgi:hypothetical protein